ncbi:MAG: glycosyltransferase [Lachnospiraceae bacterium]|nr:glycosyltransferase [Lachnospiraceae bacterium]
MVSIIVPVYNVREYLDRCVKSILSQTFEDFELFLVDDGSTDGSGELCDSYSDPRIRVFHNANEGPSAARNTALDVMSGDHIMYVDSDDYIDHECLELLMKTAGETGADIVQCANDRVSPDSPYTDSRVRSDEEPKVLTGRECLFPSDFKAMVVWGKLYKAEIFSSLRFPVGKYNEDYAVLYRLVYPLQKVAILKDVMYHYSVRESSITGSFSKKLMDQLGFMDEKLLFYREKNEKILYDNALREKAYYILTCYHNAEKSGDAGLCRDLKKRYLEVYPEVMKLQNISGRNRISLFLSKFYPGAWVNMGRAADRIRSFMRPGGKSR